MKSKCIIVEDEPLAQDIIETYLSRITDLELMGRFDNSLKAFEYLAKHKVDLMFLDIRMPQLNGIELLKTMKDYPAVIITTAYRDYAPEGFELNVIDYLLKPFSFERFLKAVGKFYRLNNSAAPVAEPVPHPGHIYVLSDRKQVKILLDDILYIESMKDYVIIHKEEQKVITKNTLSYFEDILPRSLFIRIHRSYIVSVKRIISVSKTAVEIGRKELTIGRQYKDMVINALGINSLK